MKELITALGLAWLVMMLVGCQSPSHKILIGDRSGRLAIERANGIVQDLTMGTISMRHGAWIQDLSTGRLHYTYGGFIEE